MPYNVSDFGTKINIWTNNVKKHMKWYVQKVCREISEEIIETAPCDTGAYIGNWTPSINVPQTSNDFVPGPSKYKGRSKFKGAYTSINRERAISHVKAKLDIVIPLISTYGSYYFNNGVRHARYVEYGGGATPPYAVVRRAMAKFRRQLTQSATFGSGKWSNVGKGI